MSETEINNSPSTVSRSLAGLLQLLGERVESVEITYKVKDREVTERITLRPTASLSSYDTFQGNIKDWASA